ncbi:carbonic anhydrase family protein [Demequina sp. B12]|uniref:carbonic anhydrase family protein n=1 Tax=Demequina sp. B12 TaxID=2992757 RepID=UPI00237B0299|nr:carbonic anhydrase family protein [Demequina sp. B12]MDE0572217.1 carbonic anhydrase family protein [Demequina sp. B12]
MTPRTIRFTGVAGAAALLTAAALTATPATASEEATTGDSQSPIDIRDEDLTYVENLPRLRVHYDTSDVHVHNNGSPDHEASVKATPAEDLYVTVGGEKWPLAQFHWHTESEHLRNGEPYVMEGHFVHQQDDGDLLVIGVFVEEDDRNRALRPLFSQLPASHESVDIENLRIDDILPDDLESYRYSGSLTTSPYSEPVNWIVLDEPIEMSRSQIAAFQELFPEGNTREAQPLNDRTILTDVDDFEEDDD